MTTDEAERAVLFLRDSAKRYGTLRGHEVYCDANLRRVKSIKMLAIAEGSVADREAKAYASDEYLAAIVELQNATAAWETLRAQRDAAQHCIDMWRTQSSAKSKGIDL